MLQYIIKMRPYLLLSTAVLIVLLLISPDQDAVDEPGAPATVAPHQVITATEARALMDSGEPYILLDVRTQAEFERRHIPGARLLPLAEIPGRARLELEDPDARILLYCETGRRSADAAGALAQLGFTKVYDFGGIANWPYEIVSG